MQSGITHACLRSINTLGTRQSGFRGRGRERERERESDESWVALGRHRGGQSNKM